MWETLVLSLGWEDPLEKEMTVHSSILETPTNRGAWQATVRGVAKSWTWLSNWARTLNGKSESYLVVFDSLGPHGLYSPWNFPGQNTGVDGRSLLRGIFPTQGMNPGLPHGRCSLPAEPPGKSAVPFKDSSDGFRLTKESLSFLKLHHGPSAGSHLKRGNYIKIYSRR